MKDIVLLTIDCLRADHCSWMGYKRETTPALDKLAADSTVFSNAYSASSHTPEALPAILTGKDPDVFSDNGYQLNGNTVASKLSKVGYRTGGFHSNVNVSRVYDYGNGFDTFDDDLFIGKNRILARLQRLIKKHLYRRPLYYSRADTINERCLQWVNKIGDEPMFLWAHYMDVHGPYDPVKEYREYYQSDPPNSRNARELFQRAMENPNSITDKEKRLLINLYDTEIRYVDSQINELLSELDDRDRLDDTLLIITADHGDGFGEHGYYNHPRYLDNELIHVPLIIHDLEHNSKLETPVSTLDIVPTILDWVNIDASGLPGRSLQAVEPDESRVVMSQARGEDGKSNLRRFRGTSINNKVSVERDIKTGEIKNTSEKRQDSNMLEEILSYSQKRISNGSSDAEKSAQIESSEVNERLEALGYK